MFTKTKSFGCITWTSCIFWLSNGTRSYFRVSLLNVSKIKKYDVMLFTDGYKPNGIRSLHHLYANFRWINIRNQNWKIQPRLLHLYELIVLKLMHLMKPVHAEHSMFYYKELSHVTVHWQSKVRFFCQLEIFWRIHLYFLLNRTRAVLVGFYW